MKRIGSTLLVLVIVSALFLTCWSFAAGAEENVSELEISPLNPEFAEYQQLESNELAQSLEENSSGNSSENNSERLGYIPSPINFSGLLKPESENKEGRLLVSDSELPAIFDLREENRVTSVKDQENSGSCWAFASISSLESYLLNSTGEEWDFSENNMKNLLSPTYPEGFDIYDGGNAPMATAYLARWTGPVNESDDPFNDASDTSPENLAVQKHVQDVLFLPVKTRDQDNSKIESEIKRAIMEYGAVDSSFYIDTSNSNFYSKENCSYYYTGSTSPNHAITIVGWNDSYDKNLFSSIPSGNGAFIAKNSWGTDWGKDGYFYISYYDSKLGYDENSVFTAGPLDNYDYIYQYDPLGWVETIGYTDNNTAWGANVFLAGRNEILKAVSFYTTDSSTSCEVYVYKNPDSGPINSTGYELCENGSFTYSGYHTHVLSSPVAFSSGETLSVVIKFENQDGSSKNPLAFEYPEHGYSTKANASKGQSYISSDGSDWDDLTEVSASLDLSNANLCIKAFTIMELPVANFTVNVTNGATPLTVQFNDTSTGSISSRYWDFGDGNNSTELNPVHTYAKGKYSVNLTVTNARGSDYEFKTDYITVLEPPVANFTATSATTGTAPLTVQFNDSSTGEEISSWLWNFGDGNSETIDAGSSGNITHTYTKAGNYSVMLNVSNAGGNSSELKTDYITVIPVAPTANFTANVTSGNVPLTVQFNDSSAGEPTSWYWEFGDGNNSILQNPVHTYITEGNYNVTLNATNSIGNDSKLKLDYLTVLPAPPVASFTSNVTSGTVPLSVQFNDSSAGGEPASWYWEFGDGNNSTLQNPVHTYIAEGNYNVNLNVTNAGGSDSVLKSDYITVSSISSSSSSSGSSGGGGGGASVSPYTSSETIVKEIAQSYTSAGEAFKVTFSDEKNPVIEALLVPKVAAGKVYVTVIALNGIPDSIGSTPNGEIFQVLDIDVSKSLGSKLESGNITFKVTKEWLDSLGENYTVVFQHFEDEKWIDCPTEPSSDDAYTFIASIDSCSPFAITAVNTEVSESEGGTEITTPLGEQTEGNETPSAEETTTEETGLSTTLKISGGLIGLVILILIGIALSRNEKQKNKKE